MDLEGPSQPGALPKSGRVSNPNVPDLPGMSGRATRGQLPDTTSLSVPPTGQRGSNVVADSGRKPAPLPPRADHQVTPFGLNRFLLLGVYVLYVAASARVLFGWPHLSNMLLRDGAYRWRCEGEQRVEGMRYDCTRQDSSVQLLFTLGIGVSFCFSLVAGSLLDWRGPRLTASLGQLFSTVGWVMMGLSNQHRQLYIPAVIFMAMGADAGYLPSLTIANLFPGYEPLVIVGLCAAMSASFSVTSILDAAWRSSSHLSFRKVCLFYAGLGTGVCFLLAVFCMPTKAYKSQDELTLAHMKETENNERRSSTDSATEANANMQPNRKVQEATFTSQVVSRHFLLFLAYWPLNALFYNFYITSAEHLFGKDINNLIGILGPVSMIPSILLGVLADRYGVMALVLFIISSGVGMYAFALMPFRAAHYISPIFSCLYVSNFSGQMYAYVADTFRSTDFGRIVGIISVTGGIVGLLRIPINDKLTLQVFDGNYRYTCAIMLGITLFCLAIAVWLFYIKREQQKAFVSEEELNQRKQQRAATGAELQSNAGGSLNWA